MSDDGWRQHEKLILHRLDGCEERLASLEETVVLMRIEEAQRKVKAGLWGALFGATPGIVAIALVYSTKGR